MQRRRLRVTVDDYRWTPARGDVVTVIAYDRPGTHRIEREITRSVPRTNLTHEPRVEGWLGAFNDVSAYAEGRYRVVSAVLWSLVEYIAREADVWQVSLTRIDA